MVLNCSILECGKGWRRNDPKAVSRRNRARSQKPSEYISSWIAAYHRNLAVVKLHTISYPKETSLCSCNKRRLAASDCQEGNRRDYNMSGNQTLGEKGGVQCIMTAVCMYVCLISYMSRFPKTYLVLSTANSNALQSGPAQKRP